MGDGDIRQSTGAPRDRRAVIVGAGIAGLAAADRLRRIGWEPVVVERSDSRRDGGYTIVLHGVGYDAAEGMGILPALRERHFDPFDLRYVRSDGTPWFSLPRSFLSSILGARSLTLLRGDIEDVLYRNIEDRVEIRFGATVREVGQDDGGVRVTLDDGSELEADLLIGADGLHSTVRRLVFGPEEDFRTDLDQLVVAMALDQPPSGIAEGTTTRLSAIGRTVTVSSLGDGRACVYFIYRSPDPAGELAKGPEQAVAHAFGDLGWLVPQLRTCLDRTGAAYFDSISQITMSRWSHGRVTLLGDAAWCVSPFAGYGASLALGGADLLASRLHDHGSDVRGALTQWEASLRPTVRRRQRLGRRNASGHAPPTVVHLTVRNHVLRLAGRPAVERAIRRLLRLRGLT
jgi:2-polyprenyl-6-methoxyphenol hydroxylase-like FAD-dependent oxidoreductase